MSGFLGFFGGLTGINVLFVIRWSGCYPYDYSALAMSPINTAQSSADAVFRVLE